MWLFIFVRGDKKIVALVQSQLDCWKQRETFLHLKGFLASERLLAAEAI